MPIGCDDVGARMLELLYGELPEGERAAIQAHLDRDAGGCERCRRELADLQSARAHARQVLDEAPPARAHAAILRAAEAAAAARARVVPTVTPAARGSGWDRLRSRWTFPTLATIGAVAVFLLANKIFLEPDKTVERGRQGLVPTEAPAPAAQAPAAEAPTANERATPVAPEPARPAKPSGEPASSPPPALGGRGSNGSSKGAATGADDLPMGAPASHRRALPPRSQEKTAKRESLAKESAAEIHRTTRAERAVGEDDLDRSFAAPPPPRIAQPAPAAPHPAAKKSISADALEDLLEDSASGGVRTGAAATGTGAAATETGAAATGARAKAAPSPAQTEAESPSAAAPRASAPKTKRHVEDDADERQLEAGDEEASALKQERPDGTPVARADRLFAAGRWVEAANAYRELLRRDPRNPDAARWRKRLAQAEEAINR